MRIPRLFSLLLTMFLPVLFAEAQPAAHTQVSLLSDNAAVTPGQSLQLGLRMKSQPRWHTYWKNPGNAGSATEIEWEKIQNASPGEWQWPAPKLFRQEDIFNFVYEGDTTILIPVTISGDAKPGEKITFSGKVSWLECDDSSCHPQEAPVSLTLPVAEKSTPANSEIFSAAKAALPRKTDAWQITASRSDGKIILRLKPTTPDAAGTVENILFFPTDDQVPPGAPVQTLNEGDTRVFVFDVKDALQKDGASLGGVLTAKASWLKSDTGAKALDINVAFDAKAAPATALAGSAAAPAIVAKPATGAPEWEPWTLARQEELLAAGKTVYVDFTAGWCATCLLNKRVYADKDVIDALSKNEIVLLRADWTNRNPEIADELAKYNRAAIPFNVFLRKDAPPVTMPELLTAGAVLDGIAGKGGSVGKPESVTLLGAIFFGFLGGLILNLMPCVFPVIGLKIMGFVNQSGESRAKIAKHGLIFSAGVVISFWILAGVLLALRLGGAKIGWGFQMQNPAFLLAMTVLMLVFGLNMAGVFEVGGRAVGVGANLTSKQGYAGSFFSGILATIIATPCAAPFLAPALGAALALSPAESFLIFTAVALGLSTPYLFLSFVPVLIKFLPRPGAWMETFKQGLSFLLFGTVLYFMWVLSLFQQIEKLDLLKIFLGLAVIAFACWVYGRWTPQHRKPKARFIGGAIAGILFLGTCGYFWALLK